MKKLLSLLNILIITETCAPITIASNIYQKKEKKLENLNKIKRQKQNNNENKKINNILKIVIYTNDIIYFSGFV